LREHYVGPVTILIEPSDCQDICLKIANTLDAEIKAWDHRVSQGKNRHYLVKTRYHLGTPYETTIALDSDTLILGALDELFSEAERSEFCVPQFSDWKSSHKKRAGYLQSWQSLRPADLEQALKFGPAINTGVIAFVKDALFFRDWFDIALPGRHLRIPDEIACQLTLYKYPHRVLNRRWNCSARNDDPNRPDTRIIHYHTNSHCRFTSPADGTRWTSEFVAACQINVASIGEWMPAGDIALTRYLAERRGR
jgi:hypothetical protein